MARWARGRADYWQPGDWNAACSMCGRKRKASEMVKNWQGQWRCPEHNEARQPQDFVRGVQDIQTPPWVQVEQDIDIEICTFDGISAVPGVGIPGCMIPGRGIWSGGGPNPFQGGGAGVGVIELESGLGGIELEDGEGVIELE